MFSLGKKKRGRAPLKKDTGKRIHSAEYLATTDDLLMGS